MTGHSPEEMGFDVNRHTYLTEFNAKPRSLHVTEQSPLSGYITNCWVHERESRLGGAHAEFLYHPEDLKCW